MPNYQIDYDDLVVNNMSPDKRTDKHISWVKALVSQVKRLYNITIVDYIKGAWYPEYSGAVTYPAGYKVLSSNAVYESKVGDNTGNAVGDDNDYWIKTQDSFVGAEERASYWASVLIFEFALNKWFGGIFRQPPDTSDIYISEANKANLPFIVGNNEFASSVGITTSIGAVGISNPTAAPRDYVINFPQDLYDTISGGDSEISLFADKINTAGLTYSIDTY